jgi:hypothetical protein
MYLESVVVVWVDPKVGEEAVNHQVDVLLQERDTARKRLVNLHKKNTEKLNRYQ